MTEVDERAATPGADPAVPASPLDTLPAGYEAVASAQSAVCVNSVLSSHGW